ncbi:MULTISPECIES: MBL fold metallo-hydrolase [Rahnella]|jgi:glyoxylase-like metal-dependent hydrolase (beta-lactamase superfamily II)|uniref:Beta-lactamase domain-containing protein n=1 Tax=Rahnella sp. (strain Y9602) TaxID=2703885 RepID=A0A0H3F6A6_RAHSY|nr:MULTISPECIES: MBL fold metallo-hydrolase [Rahnella]AFE57021.1 beta-lactamase domain-containing protein [Rahnella aquatilis HX2]AYA05791.1 MBL fold metallo-hydrolase [Rahnella aquatilis]ADW72439.1 beta-lactamase domain-containing protein [Rahnella aceris]AZP41031.1 MBL fold metallo-hydrolase [Rahnella aquatilis]AZP45372.1 MBL fold metallo-hydrolase [Rahnella aquatilis]
MQLKHLTLIAALLGSSLSAHAASALKMDVYNPGEKSVFPVSSEIITGDKEAVLIDAQFQRNDAEKLVEMIKATGKKLTTVYISQSDPDYYFGLDVIHAAFPDAKIVATQATIDQINASKDGKVAFWGPQLKDNAPKSVVVPEPLKGTTFELEGHKFEVQGVDKERTFVWIPSLKAVVGGVLVNGNNMHVWTADTQTPKSRKQWVEALNEITGLNPQVVVPGHFLPGAPKTLESVEFTRQYLLTLEKELPKAKDSAALIAAMKKHYPQLKDDSSLQLSAKVLKGEMKWPQ